MPQQALYISCVTEINRTIYNTCIDWKFSKCIIINANYKQLRELQLNKDEAVALCQRWTM